ncbi:Lar family restriction alleviation protein [Pseudomonas sp. TUM22785]|uniref:Lar family restriction alleviation protein n=1 Tax=Pseudomonas sp. TUM22785 TaxID=3019098 RepID=UPI0023061A70|nr:Lar family restriction alleviation protein [Pseudomonas sp. TUM22785]WCD79189.1 Lar family restriction alleviation protein [Pseudomonas sp. TUM22785]
MSEELKPCPFCGETPDLPSGDGTYYVIECRECGGAVVGIQISDLMTIEERQSDPFTDYRYAEQFIERAKAKAAERWNTRATPPAAQVKADPTDIGELFTDSICPACGDTGWLIVDDSGPGKMVTEPCPCKSMYRPEDDVRAAQVQGEQLERERREIVGTIIASELRLMVYLLREISEAGWATPVSKFAEEIEKRLAGYEEAKEHARSVNPPHPLAALSAPPAADMADAYVGAREDVAIWKRRALEAEEKVRVLDQRIDQLVLDAQGETRIGEPFIAPPAAGTTSDQYRAELYDEVWQKARDMGYGNVTNALVELERMKATPPAAGVPTVGARPQTCNWKSCGWCNEGAEPCHYVPPAAGVPEMRGLAWRSIKSDPPAIGQCVVLAGPQGSDAPGRYWRLTGIRRDDGYYDSNGCSCDDATDWHELLESPGSTAPTPPASEQQQAVEAILSFTDGDGRSAFEAMCREQCRDIERDELLEWKYVNSVTFDRFIGFSSACNRIRAELLRLNPHLAGVNQGVTEAGNGGEV